MNCEFKGCMFPAMFTVRDINADVNVCRQHEMFYREERGSFSDPTILAVQRANEQKPADFVFSRRKEDGRTVDDLLSIVRLCGTVSRKSNRRYSGKLAKWSATQANRRARQAERDNSAIAFSDLKIRLGALSMLYQMRRQHHRQIFTAAKNLGLIAVWAARQKRILEERQLAKQMIVHMRQARALAASDRKRVRDEVRPPRWKKYIDPLVALPVGESITFETDGKPNFGKRLRTMIAVGNSRLYSWNFRTKTIGHLVTVHKSGEFYSSIQ